MTTTLVNLELIADWLKENVCPHLQYKRPNDDNNDGTYNYQLVNPDVHIMYIPPKDILPEKKYAAPSILVQYDNNKNFPKERKGLINIRLGFLFGIRGCIPRINMKEMLKVTEMY